MLIGFVKIDVTYGFEINLLDGHLFGVPTLIYYPQSPFRTLWIKKHFKVKIPKKFTYIQRVVVLGKNRMIFSYDCLSLVDMCDLNIDHGLSQQ